MTSPPTEPDSAIDPVLAMLALLGVDHEVMACDPDLADTTDFCAAYGIDPSDSANAILVAGKSRPGQDRPLALCMVLATHRLDVNGIVRKRLDTRKASFAGAEETALVTGMTIGGVTPFGLPSPLPVWIDTAVMARDRIVVGGGSRDRKLLIPPAGLLKLALAEAVDGLAHPAPIAS